ncbi:MAG: hypothetical protein WC758_02135 [Candidatus Woesearchaeota archaeon]|jgi:hypothetical protein
MFGKSIKSDLPLDQVLTRVEKEVAFFNEVYYAPKKEGVINLFVPKSAREIMQDRLTYLQVNTFLQDVKKAQELIIKLQEMGQIMGFDERGVARQENPYRYELDLSKKLPTKNGLPFFAWGSADFLTHNIEFLNDIKDSEWNSRSIGPINDSNGNASYNIGQGITMFTKLPKAMQTHGLTFDKKYLVDGVDTDTRLSFDCGYSCFEGFEYSFSFSTKNGKLVVVHDGRDETDIHTALKRINDDLGVSPQHIKYYLDNSNLSKDSLEQISDVMHELSTYPQKDVYELFDAQRPTESLITKVKKLFSFTNVDEPKDKSDINLDSLKKHFEYVTLNNLTEQELFNVELPSEKLVGVDISFKSNTEKKYALLFQPEHVTGPYVLLRSVGHKDDADFKEVEAILNKHIYLGYDGTLSDRGDDICQTYKLNQRPTQKSISDIFQESLIPNFTDVSIDDARFKDIYVKKVEMLNVPAEKIETKNIVLL